MNNIQKVHIGEDYTKYSYEDEEGNYVEVEITGVAQQIIDTLGEALQKESFISNNTRK